MICLCVVGVIWGGARAAFFVVAESFVDRCGDDIHSMSYLSMLWTDWLIDLFDVGFVCPHSPFYSP